MTNGITILKTTDAPVGPVHQTPADVHALAALALHPAVEEAIVETIARDPDDRVRALLAQRLARMLPTLAGEHLARLQSRAVATLMTLAADEAERVRAAITDIVKDLPDAPRALVLRLAHDAAASVCEPVLRLSPLLTSEDLLALVATPPGTATITAIARRPVLAAIVADAIAGTPDVAAIAALLENPTAALSEATLDTLVVRAVDNTSWQLPLVRRRHLSNAALAALSEFVSDQILSELISRPNLPPGLAFELEARLGTAMQIPTLVDRAKPTSLTPATLPDALRLATHMAQARILTEEAVLAAARRGEARLCSAMLAVSADVASTVVERAITLRSVKGVVALVWRAGFSMRLAGPLQTLLVRVPPEAALRPSDVGGFPLSEQEMRWQIEFLTRIGRPERSGPHNQARAIKPG